MLTIRILEVDDVPAFVKIRRLSLITDPDSFSARPETDAGSNLDLARERFENATPADGPFILGSFIDELVGIVGLIRASPNSARVWGFYVKPECRGSRIGVALVERAIAVARQMPGVVRLELGVSDSSIAAIRVYERAGFGATGSRTPDGARAMVLELSQKAG